MWQNKRTTIVFFTGKSSAATSELTWMVAGYFLEILT